MRLVAAKKTVGEFENLSNQRSQATLETNTKFQGTNHIHTSIMALTQVSNSLHAPIKPTDMNFPYCVVLSLKGVIPVQIASSSSTQKRGKEHIVALSPTG